MDALKAAFEAGWSPIPDFTEYGGIPKVIVIADRSRWKLWLKADKMKKRVKRRHHVDDVDRISRRTGLMHGEDWYLDSPVKKRHGWVSLAPKSPAKHWLLGQGYSTIPF